MAASIFENIMRPLSGRFKQTRIVPLTTAQKQQYGYTTPSDNTSEILKQLQTAQAERTAATKKREEEIRGLYSTIRERYGAGGTFGAGYEAELEQQKRRYIGAQTQAAVSSGMANIIGGRQAIGGLGKTWEQEVGAPARLKLEDIRMERLTGAEQDLASFIERISEQGPDLNLIASLLQR